MQLYRIFGVLIIMMNMKSEKTNLKISSDISSLHQRISATIIKWSWLEKLIDGGKIIISTFKIGWSYKIFFVLGMLYILRAHNSVIWSLNVS